MHYALREGIKYERLKGRMLAFRPRAQASILGQRNCDFENKIAKFFAIPAGALICPGALICRPADIEQNDKFAPKEMQRRRYSAA
jgi:hypothetical protein